MSSPEPLTQLKEEAAKAAISRWKRGRDLVNKWVGNQLLGIAVSVVGAGGLLWAAFPWAVAVLGCVVLVAALLYAVYSRKQLINERTMRRRAFIRGKRAEQKVLQSELALRNIAIGLAGNPGERRRLTGQHIAGAREIRQAADYVTARAHAHVAKVDPSVRAQAARRRGEPIAPKSLDVGPWIRRADVLVAQVQELEAEIQALSVPDSAALEEALKVSRERRRAAHEADSVARERLRKGRTPSPANRSEQLIVSERIDGNREVARASASQTPEQIADGSEGLPRS